MSSSAIGFDSTITVGGSGGGSGITALTGDVTASGTGSVAAALASTIGAAHAFSGAITFSGGATITGGDLILLGGSRIDARNTGAMLQLGNGSYGTHTVQDGGSIIADFNTASTGDSFAVKAASFCLPSAATIAVAGTTAAPNWATGSTQTIDISGASGNVTATFANPVVGGRYTVVVLGKTGTTFTFATVAGVFKWAGGVAPTVTATTGKTDLFDLYFDGTNYLELSRAQNQ